MTIICPRCGGGDCVIPADLVLDSVYQMYVACPSCAADPTFGKQTPFSKLGNASGVDDATMRCPRCGKRHLDVVVAHVLNILIREGLRDTQATLFDVGTPMITIGYQIPFPPRLSKDTLVLIMDAIDKKTAEMIISEVPEVKGVIKRKGSRERPIGILDTGSSPHTYDLLAGCDLRGDIVSSAFGELCIYKTQSDTHIEYSRGKSDKVQVLESLYYQRKLGGCVVDGCCGAGTLGLISVLAGAQEVILNDAFLPAVKNTILNIQANASVLGLELEVQVNPSELPTVASTPMLVATAHGSCNVSVYHGDLTRLAAAIDHCDLCLIDAFINVPTADLVEAWKATAQTVITI
ncbi:MAG: hypothetical protein EF813_05705 [Methanosarcinales archaeon]|nr:MAG: hypothetical protein EF813_05705 [Methanosarcinales archaeon]